MSLLNSYSIGSRCRSIRREWWWPSRLVDYDQRTLSLVSSAYGCAPDLPSILTRVLEVLIPCVSISQKSWYRQFMSDRYRSITRSVTPLDRFISCVPYTAYPRSTSVFTTLVCFIRWRFSRGTLPPGCILYTSDCSSRSECSNTIFSPFFVPAWQYLYLYSEFLQAATCERGC
ncbi:hypothetical protein L210DRAFT_50901 [Boletus edulis BED1]|uniref:Uncharacterized protein n=1 Tax=Boletus edulis BED1 TaxID=1328754 RepID=A0AAD4C2N2_BOLED|nr:hypothetical protein L210DRAFT_50901 [Boletus edulis BED1]